MITRADLAALGMTTLCIAALAFFVGLKLGRAQVSASPATTPQALLPDAEQEDALEMLLHEVEDAQTPTDLSFRESLAEGEFPEVPTIDVAQEGITTDIQPDPEPPPSPVLVAGPPPEEGWAVQVASFEVQLDADAHIQMLLEEGYAAYQVAALVNGRNWHRVKVGGYSTKEDASEASEELAALLEITDLQVSTAP
jgi:septal ring-binding cell division protein DamX